MNTKTLAKKALLGLTIVGMAVAFGGCGDSTPTASSKPKSDLERYDEANKDLQENVKKIQEFEKKSVNDYINKDKEKYAILQYVYDNNGNKVSILASSNNLGTDKNGHAILTPTYTKEQATAAADALNNIINSNERTEMMNKIKEDDKVMSEIAKKAANNTNGSLENKYYDDRKSTLKVTSKDYNLTLKAQYHFNLMTKNNNPKFWKQ